MIETSFGLEAQLQSDSPKPLPKAAMGIWITAINNFTICITLKYKFTNYFT
jgi:hypothetical protein